MTLNKKRENDSKSLVRSDSAVLENTKIQNRGYITLAAMSITIFIGTNVLCIHFGPNRNHD